MPISSSYVGCRTGRLLMLCLAQVLLWSVDKVSGVQSVQESIFKLPADARMTFLGVTLEDALLSPTAFNGGLPIRSCRSAYDAFTFECDGSMDGEENQCIIGMNMTVTPYYPRNVSAPGGNTPLDPDMEQGRVSVEWMNDTLNDIRSTCGDLGVCGNFSNGTYVYVLPYYQFCPPNVQCGVEVHYMVDGDTTGPVWNMTSITNTSDIRIRNKFNSSTVSYRELYGIPEEYQGDQNVVQLTSMQVESGLQVERVYEYLDALQLTYDELNFAFGEVNNETLCEPTQDNPYADCGEQLLDVTTMMGMAPLAFTSFLPNNNSTDILQTLDTLITLINASDVKPDVISWSWGADYPGVDNDFYSQNVTQLEELLQEIAMMNITIVVGPGDVGAAGNDDGGCITKEQGGLFQTWPGTSPWAVSVGATMLQTLAPGSEPQEVVATGRDTCITSAGGFTGPQFKMTTPSWQQSAVDTYLSQTGPQVFGAFPTKGKAASFNPSGRGYPDVAALGWGQMLMGPDGEPAFPVSGTSLAAPIVASLFTIANQKLKSEGYDTIGYANPMLYWMGASCPQAFNDVVFGNNTESGFGSFDTQCDLGYPATPGWDAASGWGSINFIPFVDCAMKYQDLMKAQSPDPSPNSAPARVGHNLMMMMMMMMVFPGLMMMIL